MSNQRPSFAKRDREMKLKDKARAKAERRTAKRAAKAAGIYSPQTGPEPSADDFAPSALLLSALPVVPE